MCTKNNAAQGEGNITDPCVANTDLVPPCSSTTIQPTVDFQTLTKPTTSCPLQGTTPSTQESAPNGLPFIRNTFAQQDLPPDITNILMASNFELKTSTKPMWKNGWHFVVKEKSITVLQR